MKNSLYLTLLSWIVSILLGGSVHAQTSYVDQAKTYIDKISKPSPPWDGPTTGPTAQRAKTVIYVSADQRNGGAWGVGKAAEEAAKVIGWNFRLIDGQGSIDGRNAALKQASNLNPDGIILGTVDANEHAAIIKLIAAKNIKIIGWHSMAEPGPAMDHGIFTNIGTNPYDVARAAALYAVADSNGNAGVVIYNDPLYAIGIAKADAMAEVIRKCSGCRVLEADNTHLTDTPALMPKRTASLLHRYGKQWTHGLATNDLYFDYMPPTFLAAAIPGGGPPRNISAGDGSIVAFERIRKNRYQIGTVAEPLRVHGWQAIDELNRAFAGKKDSGYSTPVHLITAENIKFDGGSRNEFDPDNGYRNIYKKIWGVK